MFRKLYWVVEEFDGNGASRPTGVYTSITDLVDEGFRRLGDDVGKGFRLTLVKLDSSKDTLGSWLVPGDEFSGSTLAPYVASQEMTPGDVEYILAALPALATK